MTRPRRRWLLLAVLAAAIVVGLAAGIVLAHGGTNSTLVKGHPAVLARGTFRSVGWGTYGKATIARDAAGHVTLRLSSDFQTQRAPALYVFLVRYRGKERRLWQQVGPLRRAWGAQRYELPASTPGLVGASVAIYCEKCNKVNGLAALRSPGRPLA
jgi:hypothetical protein